VAARSLPPFAGRRRGEPATASAGPPATAREKPDLHIVLWHRASL